jgi:galactoside O-acetyltransferase
MSGFLTEKELQELGFASLGEDVKIDSTVRIYGASRISIKSHVRIDAYTVLSAGADGIEIGNYVHIGAFAFVAGSGKIVFEDFSGISGRVSIYSSNDDYSGTGLTNPTVPQHLRNVTSAPVLLGKHVIVGSGSVILPGVTIGLGACVGALSLVRGDVGEFEIVVGQPARAVAERKQDFLKLEKELPSTTE